MENNVGRILIVDDQTNWRKALSSILMADGYEVVSAGSFEQAIAYLSTEKFDLVTLDIRLADEDILNVQGLELLRLIKEQQQPPKVIILTGYPDIVRDEALRTYKPDGFINKVPSGSYFDIKNFRSIIQHLL
ncbi:MAG TPA: response regulator [Anaerolineae bacterium]|nr:response regulator [Anaerolineae bacterium]HQI85778.1 response regulator [Anaerolineae bacterium]